MTTYTESFDQANSSVLGPDLTWAKFSSWDHSAEGTGPDDGETVTGVVFSDSFDRDYPDWTASSSATSNGANTPDKAIDFNDTTFWQPIAGVVNPTLVIDRGAAAEPITFAWVNSHSTLGPSTFYPIDYTIDTSTDNSSWTTRATVTGNSSTENHPTFAATTDRYLRIRVTARQSDGADIFAHLALLEFAGGYDLAAIDTDSYAGGTPATWVPNSGTWRIYDGRAVEINNDGGQYTTVIETGLSDCVVEVTLESFGDNGLCWRSTDDNNNWVTNNQNVFKRVAGAFTAVGSSFSPVIGRVLHTGDRLRAILSGDDMELWVQRDGAGPFVALWSGTDSFNNTATKHGLRSDTGFTYNDRFKNFIVSTGGILSGSFGVSGGDRSLISMYSDSFDRADSATDMGYTDSAFGGAFGSQFWANGVWGISSNQAYNPAGAPNATRVIFADRANGYVQVTIAAGTEAGVCYRWFDSNNFWHTTKAGHVRKRVAGTYTDVFTLTTGAIADGDTIIVHMVDDVHTFYVNGVAAGSFSDSDHQSEVYHGLYSDSSSNSRFDDFRVYVDPTEVGAFARAEHDTGSTSVYAQAEIAALQVSDPNNYPTFLVGASLDDYAGPLPYNEAYNGPTGLWAVVEPLGYTTAAGIYAYVYNAVAGEFLFIDFSSALIGSPSSYVEGPTISAGDVIRVDHDAVNGYLSVSVNGTEYCAGSYDLGSMASPVTFGQRGGLGIFSYNGSVVYVPDVDRLDNFETGTSSLVGPTTAEAELISATGAAYNASIVSVNDVHTPSGTRWELYDYATDTAFLFSINPNEGGSPFRKKTITKQPTVAPRGKTLIFEGSDEPLEFKWSGIILTQEHFEMFTEWFETNKQLLLSDDLGRQTFVYLTEFTPKRAGSFHYHYRHTYTATAIELDWQ